MRPSFAIPLLAATCLAITSAAAAAQESIDGANLFIKLGCGWCHEDGGRRPGKGPQLMNSKRSDEYMMNRIATGRPGRMPAFGNSLSAEQLEALMTYIRSLKPSA